MSSFERVRSRITPHVGPESERIGARYAYKADTDDYYPNPFQEKVHSYSRTWMEGEITGDEIHPGPPYRSGGPFRNLKVSRVQPLGIQGYGHHLGTDGQYKEKYVGGFAPPDDGYFGGLDVSNATNTLKLDSSAFPGISSSDRERAWKLSKPRLEKASAMVAVAELRDLPRMLKTTAQNFHDFWKLMGGNPRSPTLTPRGVADSFLNEEFGWRPFLSDIKKMLDLVHKVELEFKQIAARNGKPTRRRVTIIGEKIVDGKDGHVVRVDPVISSTKISGGFGNLGLPSSLPTQYYDGQPTWEVHEVVEDVMVATSKWTYYNPFFDASVSGYATTLSGIRRYLTVFGLRATPSNIYRATPWTWLIDWFSNLGQLVDTMSDYAIDEVVCHYMYISRTRITRRVLTQVLPFKYSKPITFTWEKTVSTKERTSAMSPYGFSLSWDDLTPRQLAILGALGVARRVPKGL